MDYMNDANTIEEKLMKIASQKRRPINGSIELLPLCNMNCDMCYVRLSKKEMKAQGRILSADEWIKVGRQMKDAGVVFLLLTGGEPLLHPEFKKIFTELQKMGMVLTINTNGTLIDEQWASFFLEHRPRRINITLYGCDDDSYSNLFHYPGGFHKVIRGIELLKKNNIDVKISSSITKSNYKDIEKIIQIGNTLDVPVRIDTYMMPSVRERNKPYNLQCRLDPITAARCRISALRLEMGEELYGEFVKKSLFELEHMVCENIPGKMTCNAGKCSFTVNWQGYMRPCVIMSYPSLSILDTSFEDAWTYIVEQCEQIGLSSICNGCKKKKLCRTCAASALLETGNFNGTPQYMCDYTDETIRLLNDK